MRGGRGEALPRCPVCGGADARPVLELRDLPVFCNVLWPTRAEARAAARGDLRLVACPACTHLYNAAFDPDRVVYGPGYENSLHFSERFQRWVEELAAELGERWSLDGGRVVDVGCGRGDFLRTLCRVTGATGVGFDRAAGEDAADPRVRLVGEFLTPDTPPFEVDLLTCRHVLEHLADPVAFLAGLREWLGAGGGSPGLYVEVPNAAWILERGGVWDLIYEHVSIFTARSLETLVRRAGFEPLEVREAFGGQYLQVQARPTGEGGDRAAATAGHAAAAAPGHAAAAAPGHAAAAHASAIAAFEGRFRERIDALRATLDEAAAAGHRLALWGIGSKGVTFLNLLDPGPVVGAVVDVNPRKHGRFVPGTGHRVDAPEALAAAPPAGVLVSNPIYLGEIEDELRRLGVPAPVEAL